MWQPHENIRIYVNHDCIIGYWPLNGCIDSESTS